MVGGLVGGPARVVHPERMSRRRMITALAKAMKASMTQVLRSVQIWSFRNPRVCQELVPLTRRAPACSGNPLMLITPSQPNSESRARVLALW